MNMVYLGFLFRFSYISLRNVLQFSTYRPSTILARFIHKKFIFYATVNDIYIASI